MGRHAHSASEEYAPSVRHCVVSKRKGYSPCGGSGFGSVPPGSGEYASGGTTAYAAHRNERRGPKPYRRSVHRKVNSGGNRISTRFPLPWREPPSPKAMASHGRARVRGDPTESLRLRETRPVCRGMSKRTQATARSKRPASPEAAGRSTREEAGIALPTGQ